MRKIALPCVLLLLGQTIPAGHAPQAEATQILQAAAGNLGGADRLASLDRWFLQGRGRENLSAELQGLSAGAPTWRPHEETVAVVRSTGAVAWERHTPRNDLSLRWRRFIYRSDGFGVVDWTTGRGRMNADAAPAPERAALARRVPHLLVLEAATRATAVRSGAARRINGAPHDVVHATLQEGVELTLVFARAPVRLAGVEYSAYLPGLGDVVVAWQWRGWTSDAVLGLKPAGHAVHVDGAPFQEVAYSRYEAGAAEAAAMMEIPSELKPVRADEPVAPAGAATGEVAPGVHVASVRGFLVMFVEFKDFIVLFDAAAAAVGLEAIPASNQAASGLVTEDIRALIGRTSPGKPVRYVVVSHHHGDHLGGVRAFATAGTTILVARGDLVAARRALSAPQTRASRPWEGTLRDARLEVVRNRRIITDGTRALHVVNVGSNPHTRENLLAWLPRERMILQGDLFYYQEGGAFPPSGRGTMNRFFSTWLRDNHFAPAAVYGVHYSGAAGVEALDRSAARNR